MSAYPVYLIDRYGSLSAYDQAAFRGVVRVPREELLKKVEKASEDAVEINLSGQYPKQAEQAAAPAVEQALATSQNQ